MDFILSKNLRYLFAFAMLGLCQCGDTGFSAKTSEKEATSDTPDVDEVTPEELDAVKEDGITTVDGSVSEYTLKINIESAITKVIIKNEGEPDLECTSNCIHKFTPKTNLQITAFSKDAPDLATRTFGMWGADCKLSGEIDNECEVEMKKDVEITPVFVDNFLYRASLAKIVPNILRNSVYLRHYNIFTVAGLPPGTYATSDTVFIKNDAPSRIQICSSMHPGSSIGDFTFGIPTSSGWAPYYNLKIARYIGGSWERLCENGSSCYNGGNGPEYLSSLTCKLKAK